jgi:tetratricopeptide (TPR) repeat protein
MLLWRARRYDEAIREAQAALDLDPSHVNALWWQGLAYAGKRDFFRSLACLQKGLEASHAPVFIGSLGYVYGLAGEREKALAALEELRRLSLKRYVSAVNFATVYAGLGDVEETFGWLERAYRARDGRVQQLVQPCFDFLRGDRRYPEWKARVGLR